MKTLCPKPGKIHPSPVEDPIRAAFRLLPATVLVLVAGLGPEDREVLAYLVTLPVELAKEAAAAVPLSEQPAARGGGGGRSGRPRAGCTTPAVWFVGHPPTHGCGCFECYISFWARWNCSPERDRILDALLAFEEHLATAESSAAPPSSSRRRERGRRSRLQATPPPPPPLPMPSRRPKSPEPQVVEAVQAPALLPPPPPPSQAPAASTAAAEEEKVVPEPAAAAEPEECREVAAEATEAEEERKRGWADVMGGVLGLRLWGIWSTAVESAT